MNRNHKLDTELKSDEHHIAVPVEVQLHLAENRRLLAEVRYELSVRRGRSWQVSTKKENEQNA